MKDSTEGILCKRLRIAFEALAIVRTHHGKKDIPFITQKLQPFFPDLASQSTLERMFRYLGQAGLVRGTRGAKGGYRLGRYAKYINLADIFVALEPMKSARGKPGKSTDEAEDPMIARLGDCFLDEVDMHIAGLFEKVNVADAASRPAHQKELLEIRRNL